MDSSSDHQRKHYKILPVETCRAVFTHLLSFVPHIALVMIRLSIQITQVIEAAFLALQGMSAVTLDQRCVCIALSP